MVELIAFTVILLGAYIQSSIGFGLAIIAAPALFVFDPAYVPAPITLSVLVLSIASVWDHRDFISVSGLKYAIIGRVPGSMLGALLLIWIDQALLGLLLGASVLFGVLISLRSVTFSPSSGHMLVAGFLSGFMGTSTSIGGPPMAMVMQHQEARHIRANLSAFFLVGSLISLALLAGVGRLGYEHVILALPMIPAALLGHWLARHAADLISKPMLRFFSLLLCSVCGAAAVISYWM